jgi:hypothetical protein
MAYFKDLSDDTYVPDNRSGIIALGSFDRESETCVSPLRVKNIGWLEPGHEFNTQTPSEVILSLLWDFCAVRVNQMRGIHECDFCPLDKRVKPVNLQEFKYAERNGQRILLGSAEVRVFGASGSDIYAAPTLVYHYISVHHYNPPSEFVEAMRRGPKPQTPEYFRALETLGLK